MHTRLAKERNQLRDVSTLFKNYECVKTMSDELYEMYKDKGITKIVGIESRGLIMTSTSPCVCTPE